MFDYRILNNDEVLCEYFNTQLYFERLSPPNQNIILNNEMLEDINNKKYSTRFDLIGDIINETDNRILDEIYNILKPFENQQNIKLQIQVKYSNNEKYNTIVTVLDLNYLVRLSRYDPNMPDNRLSMYNQICFLCNVG